MVPEITDSTWNTLGWMGVTLLMIFVIPRLTRFGVSVARLLLHVEDFL
jgi:hypothetical protein